MCSMEIRTYPPPSQHSWQGGLVWGPGAGAIRVPWVAAAQYWAALALVCWGRQDSCLPADMAAIPLELEFPSPPQQSDGFSSLSLYLSFPTTQNTP